MGDTRQQILDAALRLFTDKGYDKVTLREIADEVGVTKAALYYHFDSKEKLLETLVEPFLEMQDRFMGMIASRPTRESWAEGLTAFVQWALPHSRLFELAQANQPALEELMRRPENAAKHAELHRRTDELLGDFTGSVEEKVRMVGAAGLMWMVLALPSRNAFRDVPAERLGEAVIDAIYDVLQLKR